jgi:tetratricopeptide (TPR) repeat protein
MTTMGIFNKKCDRPNAIQRELFINIENRLHDARFKIVEGKLADASEIFQYILDENDSSQIDALGLHTLVEAMQLRYQAGEDSPVSKQELYVIRAGLSKPANLQAVLSGAEDLQRDNYHLAAGSVFGVLIDVYKKFKGDYDPKLKKKIDFNFALSLLLNGEDEDKLATMAREPETYMDVKYTASEMCISGNSQGTGRIAEMLTKVNPLDYEGWLYKAYALIQSGDDNVVRERERSLRMAETMRFLPEGDRKKVKYLSDIARDSKDQIEKLCLYEIALEIDNMDPITHLNLGLVNERLGHNEQGMDYCNQALHLNPTEKLKSKINLALTRLRGKQL